MNKNLVGGGVHWDGDFSRWEECANFQLVGGDFIKPKFKMYIQFSGG